MHLWSFHALPNEDFLLGCVLCLKGYIPYGKHCSNKSHLVKNFHDFNIIFDAKHERIKFLDKKSGNMTIIWSCRVLENENNTNCSFKNA